MTRALRRLPLLHTTLLALLALLVFSGCGGYTPGATPNNTRPPREIVAEHLRAVEAGDWDRAGVLLSDAYTMKMAGMPFFVEIDRAHAFDVHKARKTAFPDFKLNETMEDVGTNGVKVTVRWSGTHTGFLDYPVGDLPKTPATGKHVSLPEEYFVYYVEGDRIVHTYGEIPEGHGPPALKKQLGLP
ncbi:MAG: nuclear transport factor 2 family protein [Polyangiaceae bacterium]